MGINSWRSTMICVKCSPTSLSLRSLQLPLEKLLRSTSSQMTSHLLVTRSFRSRQVVMRQLRSSLNKPRKMFRQQSRTALQLSMWLQTKLLWQDQVIKLITLKRCLLQPSDTSPSSKESISTQCQAPARADASRRVTSLPSSKVRLRQAHQLRPRLRLPHLQASPPRDHFRSHR